MSHWLRNKPWSCTRLMLLWVCNPSLVLFVTDLLHPVHGLAVQLLLNGDVRHRRRGRRPVPVLLARREPDDVPWPDFLDRSAPALRPAAAGRHDQGLAERMRVPRGPGARLESDARPTHAGWLGRIEQRIDPHCAGEPIGRPLAGRPGTASFD